MIAALNPSPLSNPSVLPHIPNFSRTPPGSLIALPGSSSSRQPGTPPDPEKRILFSSRHIRRPGGEDSARSLSSRSAPTSPLSRPKGAGLGPLSAISSMSLDASPKAEIGGTGGHQVVGHAFDQSKHGARGNEAGQSGPGYHGMVPMALRDKNAIAGSSELPGQFPATTVSKSTAYHQDTTQSIPSHSPQQVLHDHHLAHQLINGPHPASSPFYNPVNFPQQPPQPRSEAPASVPRTFGIAVTNGRSRARNRNRSISSDDTETEVDSDSTFVPGRKNKHSLSQPDLTALRSRLEGWAGGVAREQMEEKRRTRPLSSRKISPPQLAPANMQYTPLSGPSRPGSKSSSSISSMRQYSPRHALLAVPPLTPVLSRTELSSSESSPSIWGRFSSLGGMTGSEDADDDYDGTDSPSSGSLTFSPKRRQEGLRRRSPLEVNARSQGLGLSLDSDTERPRATAEPLPLPSIIERMFQQSTLLELRLLAVVPAVWGVCVLLQAFMVGGLWEDVWPWGMDLSREALERLLVGGTWEGTWRAVRRGDMVLCIAWAICTGHFCFELTTGLTHRWRSYYSLPSTITRLASLQCLCWPATYLTLWTLGANRPLLAWTVIGITTGGSRAVQMWVTSNVVPTSPEGEKGDVTPRLGLGRKSLVRNPMSPPSPPPDDVGIWDKFTWGRKWDWGAVAREVGWKAGALLLATTAWLFWGIETGSLVRGEYEGTLRSGLS